MSINTGTDITGLSANTSYTYSLYPINANGQQSTSVTNVSFVTLPSITSASVPSISSYNSLTLSIAGAYSTVSIEYSTNGSSYNTSGTTSTNSFTISSLSANQRYYFKLTPYNSSSAAGAIVYISDANVVTLGYISTFSAPSVSDTTITLNWTGIYSNAIIYYSLTSGSTDNSITISAASTSIGTTQSITISDLISGKTYYFAIYPYNSNGSSGSPMTTYNTTTTPYGTDPGTPEVWFKFDSRTTNTNITSETSVGSNTMTMNFSSSTSISTDYKITNRTGSIYSSGSMYGSTSAQMSISGNQSITISFWVYPTTAWSGAGWMTRITIPGNSSSMDIMFRNDSGTSNGASSNSSFSVRNGSGQTIYFLSNNYIATNSWTHVCCVFNGSDHTQKYYINGLQISAAVSGGTSQTSGDSYYPKTSSGTTSFIAFTYGSSGADFLKGYMSDYRIYKAALTSNQVSGIYNFVW